MKKFTFKYHLVSDFWDSTPRSAFFRTDTIENAYFEFGMSIGRVTNHNDNVIIDCVIIEEV